MRITKKDTPITVAAKKAAMICLYAIHNPLHVFFEDRNFHYEPMDFEREMNEKYAEKNGVLLYHFIDTFLQEFDALSREERLQAYRLYRKKSDYLWRKWQKKIGFEPGKSASYRHYLASDGHIYFRNFSGEEFLAF